MLVGIVSAVGTEVLYDDGLSFKGVMARLHRLGVRSFGSLSLLGCLWAHGSLDGNGVSC